MSTNCSVCSNDDCLALTDWLDTTPANHRCRKCDTLNIKSDVERSIRQRRYMWYGTEREQQHIRETVIEAIQSIPRHVMVPDLFTRFGSEGLDFWLKSQGLTATKVEPSY